MLENDNHYVFAKIHLPVKQGVVEENALESFATS